MKVFNFFITKKDWEGEYRKLAKNISEISKENKELRDIAKKQIYDKKSIYDYNNELLKDKRTLDNSLERITECYNFLKAIYGNLKKEHKALQEQFEIVSVKGEKYDKYREKERKRKREWRRKRKIQHTSP